MDAPQRRTVSQHSTARPRPASGESAERRRVASQDARSSSSRAQGSTHARQAAPSARSSRRGGGRPPLGIIIAVIVVIVAVAIGVTQCSSCDANESTTPANTTSSSTTAQPQSQQSSASSKSAASNDSNMKEVILTIEGAEDMPDDATPFIVYDSETYTAVKTITAQDIKNQPITFTYDMSEHKSFTLIPSFESAEDVFVYEYYEAYEGNYPHECLLRNNGHQSVPALLYFGGSSEGKHSSEPLEMLVEGEFGHVNHVMSYGSGEDGYEMQDNLNAGIFFFSMETMLDKARHRGVTGLDDSTLSRLTDYCEEMVSLTDDRWNG